VKLIHQKKRRKNKLKWKKKKIYNKS